MPAAFAPQQTEAFDKVGFERFRAPFRTTFRQDGAA